MDLFKKLFDAGRRRSPWVVRFDCGGCNGCAVEALAALTPLFGAQGLGVSEVEDPERADILLVTGAPGSGASDPQAAFDRMCAPWAVLAVGDCAVKGGPLRQNAEGEGGVETVIPVHVRVPGCPPRPEAVLDGVLQALEILAPRRRSTS